MSGSDQHVCGLIALADAVRPAARDAIRELKELVVVRVVMLTGDNEATARAVGKYAGVDEVRAGCRPKRRWRRSRHSSPSSAAWLWSATR